MSLFHYLQQVLRVWDDYNGERIGRLLSLHDVHSENRNLYIEHPEAVVERQIDDPLAEIISSHIKVLYYLSLDPPNSSEAYKNQSACVMSVVKLLQACKDQNWPLPIMYVVCLDLRLLALACERDGGSGKPGEILEKAAECLMACFRVCAADSRSSEDDTKRHGMLNLVNQLFKVYFKINKLHLCKPLIRAIDSSVLKDRFPLSERVTYNYFVGRKAMFDSDYKAADEFLSFAFRNCPKKSRKNKRQILIYLIPVKMLLGIMPREEALQEYNVQQFFDLVQALKQGNVRKLDEVIEKHERFFIDSGIYLIVEKLKIIAYRNLCKRVYGIVKTHQIEMNHFMAALNFVGIDDISMDETHCIVANLIFEGRIKGYISHQHNKLVVSKQNPFPPLNQVTG